METSSTFTLISSSLVIAYFLLASSTVQSAHMQENFDDNTLVTKRMSNQDETYQALMFYLSKLADERMKGRKRIGSEFIGKRFIPIADDKRIGSEFLGKRTIGSEFLGKRTIGSEFLGKRHISAEDSEKRGIGSEFLGKREQEMKE